MHIPNSNLSRFQIKKILKCFSIDLTATQTSKLLGNTRKTINRFYLMFREIIYDYQIELFEKIKLSGEVELDESYFGAKRVRGFRGKLKRGRGTRKQPVFGILKRNGEVYTEIIPNCTGQILKDIIIKIIDYNTIVHTDGRKGYDGLVDVGFDKHYRVNHGKNEFSKGEGKHINGIENFRSFTKRRFNKFNGVRVNFNLHLKECEFRYGRSEVEIEEKLIKLLKVKLKNKK